MIKDKILWLKDAGLVLRSPHSSMASIAITSAVESTGADVMRLVSLVTRFCAANKG